MVRYGILIFIACILGGLPTHAQLVTGELPPAQSSFSDKQLVSENIVHENFLIPAPNISELLREDEVERNLGKAWRFGKVIDTSFSLTTSGHWRHFADGKSLWTLKIIATKAKSINLNFEVFKLSPSAKLFAYNKSHKDFLGALTKTNNTADGKMAIRPIKGEELQLELWVNTTEINKNQIICNQVVYGYKDVFNKTNKSFGSSGNCNININCKEGEPWKDLKRSVVMSLTNNNSRLCTGTLLNNTAQDSTPYILTANHCGNTATIFVFNYESSACLPNTDGSLSNSIYGATLKARNFPSDFILYELDTIPPSSYNVYYAGWSALPSPAQFATCIHHPNGDVKKISIGKGAVESEVYNSPGTVENHWRVNAWLKGTTEPGSSGSSLFNENQRVIGQLHGGAASCSDPNGSDYFGKFSKSWNANTDSSKSLYFWLDPLNTNQLTLDGLDPILATHNIDLSLVYTHDLEYFICDSTSFSLLIRNKGSLPIDSFTIKIIRGSQLIDSVFIDQTLNRSETEAVSLSVNNLTFGPNTLKVFISETNGSTDQNTTNDTLKREVFYNSKPFNVNFELKTDDYGYETTWDVSTFNYTPSFTLYEGGPYEEIVGGKVYRDTLCFFDSCFTFNLNDSFGDGFNGSFGSGYLLLTDYKGDTLIYENNFLSRQESYQFCITDTSTFIIDNERPSEAFNVYPNPIKRGNYLKWSDLGDDSSFYDFEIYNLNGKLVSKHNQVTQLKIPYNFVQGIYVLTAKNSKETEWKFKKKLIVY
jgi:hypothetical protein